MDDKEQRESPPPPASAKMLGCVGVAAIVGMIAMVLGTAIWYTAGAEHGNPNKKNDPPRHPRPELRARLTQSYRSAADWLVKQQSASGAWTLQGQPSPAYTALSLSALAKAPPDLVKPYAANIERGFAFLVKSQHDDGSFSEVGGSMKTYVTGVALMALSIDKAKHADAIRRAQGWIKAGQTVTGFARGGSGYGDIDYKVVDGQAVPVEKKENLSTTNIAAMGMHDSGLDPKDPYWETVREYARKNQNFSETNTDAEVLAMLKAAGYEPGNDGGFVYDILSSKAPVDPKDPTHLRSYGSMTYAGLKLYLYSGLAADAPEVKAAVDWIARNFKITEHPGFEFDKSDRASLQGLYYYYLMMARSLDAYGKNPLTLKDGTTRDWVVDLGEHLLDLQKDAIWTNANPRWYENDPVMVTAYVLHVYNILLKHAK